MKLAICLPSLNEASTIGHVTQIVDQGLAKLSLMYPDIQAEILNFDSDSQDDTVSVFLNTKSSAPKHSFVVTGNSGKGSNIREFCKYIIANDIDYALTIDSDITSINYDWISSLLEPLISLRADFVTPVYERSRFEGSSTNHLAFPIIYALTGYSIRQPIAGDFAFTKKIANKFIENFLPVNFIFRYGIDIFITLTAIRLGGKVYQVSLGKKIHAPSFHKLEHMFPQIAASALVSLGGIAPSNENFSDESRSNIIDSTEFLHKNQAIHMKKSYIMALENMSGLSWCSAFLVEEYRNTAKVEPINESRMSELWIELLTSWIKYYLTDNLTTEVAEKAGKELLPFFVLRAVNFWLWAELVKAYEVEEAIRVQAEKLKNKFKQV